MRYSVKSRIASVSDVTFGGFCVNDGAISIDVRLHPKIINFIYRSYCYGGNINSYNHADKCFWGKKTYKGGWSFIYPYVYKDDSLSWVPEIISAEYW